MIKPKIKTLAKFTNLLIKKGKKAKANTLVLKTFFFIKKKTKKNPINLVANVLKTLTPGVTTKKTVIAGRLYHLPSAITKNKALYFSCNWLQLAAKENKELKQKTLDFKLAEECFKVLKKKGQSLIYLNQHNKTVSENRPFLRFVRRRYKPRLPRKVWLRKKQMLWLSRKKKFRPKYTNTFDYGLSLQGPRKIILDNAKYAAKKTKKVTRLFKKYDSKVSSRTIAKARFKLKRDKQLNPQKYIKLALLRKKMISNLKAAKKNKKKFTKYEQRSVYFKNKYKSKTINKKNSFQSRA